MVPPIAFDDARRLSVIPWYKPVCQELAHTNHHEVPTLHGTLRVISIFSTQCAAPELSIPRRRGARKILVRRVVLPDARCPRRELLLCNGRGHSAQTSNSDDRQGERKHASARYPEAIFSNSLTGLSGPQWRDDTLRMHHFSSMWLTIRSGPGNPFVIRWQMSKRLQLSAVSALLVSETASLCLLL